MGTINNELPLAGPDSTHDVTDRAARHPPNRWSLLRRIDPTNPFDETATTIPPSGNDFGYTIYHARRGCMPTRIVLRGGGLTGDWDILRRVDMGQETGVAERFSYRVNPLPDVLRKEFNPTYGGAVLKPNSSRQVYVYPSPPLHLLQQTGADDCPNGAWFEGAVIPMEFDSFGSEMPNHFQLLGAATTPGIYWRARQFQRMTINWSPADGTPDPILKRGVHEVVAASYFPREVRSTGPNALADVRALFNASLWLTDLFGTTGDHGLGTVNAELFIPATQTSHDLNGVPPFFGQPPNNTQFQWNARRRVDMFFRGHETAVVNNDTPPPAPMVTTTSMVPTDGILAAILSNTNPGIAVGIVAVLATDPLGLIRANELGVTQLRTPAGTPVAGLGYDINNGQRLSVRTRALPGGEIGRDAGWIGIRFLFVLKPTVKDVRDAILALRASGRLGLVGDPLPSYIPDHVLDGRFAP